MTRVLPMAGRPCMSQHPCSLTSSPSAAFYSAPTSLSSSSFLRSTRHILTQCLCTGFLLCPGHFPQHLRVSLPHLLWGFIRTSPLQGIVPWTTSLKTANLPLTLPHTRMPTPAHVLLSVARRHDCTLTYYYGLNHITKEMIKTSSSVPVKVTFLGKGSLQVTKLRKRGH